MQQDTMFMTEYLNADINNSFFIIQADKAINKHIVMDRHIQISLSKCILLKAIMAIQHAIFMWQWKDL
jgi:hypothetical protein